MAAPVDPMAAAVAAASGAALGVHRDDEDALSAQIKAPQAQKQRVAKDLKNEQRRKQRLLVKAQGLDDADLVRIIGMRAAAKAKGGAKPGGAAIAAP